MCVEVQYIPGGHNVHDDWDPGLYVPDTHGIVVFRDIEGQEYPGVNGVNKNGKNHFRGRN